MTPESADAKNRHAPDAVSPDGMSVQGPPRTEPAARTADAAPPADEAADAELLRRFAAGDDGALGALAASHERRLLGVALGLLGGRRELAMEAVQEAWVRVIRHINTFDETQGRPSAWLYRITVNCCREVWRREHRAAGATAGDQAADAAAPPSPSASGRRAEVHAALAAMDDASREILLLCHCRGLTHERAAEVLGIPVGTLKTRLYTGLRELKAVLAQRRGAGDS